jgi:hypothetical protein
MRLTRLINAKIAASTKYIITLNAANKITIDVAFSINALPNESFAGSIAALINNITEYFYN